MLSFLLNICQTFATFSPLLFFVNHLPLPHSDKITYRAVICALLLCIKKTCRKLVIFPVIVNTITAPVFSLARFIGAITKDLMLFQLTFHNKLFLQSSNNALNELYVLFKIKNRVKNNQEEISFQSPLLTALIKALTILGSNCEPAHLLSSAIASFDEEAL